MQHNNHVVRLKPQLIRKRQQVILPKNVSIVMRPNQTKAIDLKTLQKPPIRALKPPPIPVVEIKPAAIPVETVTRQKLIKTRRITNKKTEVSYVSREVNVESTARIAALRNVGKGKLLVIVGNGPSITEAPLQKLRDNPKIEILTINKPDARIWPTDYWAFFDSSQFRRNEDLWNGYNGFIFNSTAIKRQKSTSMQFRNIAGKGWSRDLLKGLHVGRSSVFAGMQIGAWMNHEHIYICGCDMSPDGINGKLHFYGQNPDVPDEKRKERFVKEAAFYDHAADQMTADERLRFTFCSSYLVWPFVDKFQKLDHREAVDHILEHAGRLGGPQK